MGKLTGRPPTIGEAHPPEAESNPLRLRMSLMPVV